MPGPQPNSLGGRTPQTPRIDAYDVDNPADSLTIYSLVYTNLPVTHYTKFMLYILFLKRHLS